MPFGSGSGSVEYSFNAGQGYELCILHASGFGGDDLRQTCRFTAEGVKEIDKKKKESEITAAKSAKSAVDTKKK